MNNKKIAVYPGSFDPITLGHINIIEKASKMYDEVVIGILHNIKKNPTFSYEQKYKLIKESISNFKNVRVEGFTGLSVDFAKANSAQYIIRGMRSVSDFENELQICMANKMLASDIETVFFVPDEKYQYISSSMVREIATFGGDISKLVPAKIKKEIEDVFKGR